ncbi:hypothetical protein H8959_003039 [Pygathrix nigripes]
MNEDRVYAGKKFVNHVHRIQHNVISIRTSTTKMRHVLQSPLENLLEGLPILTLPKGAQEEVNHGVGTVLREDWTTKTEKGRHESFCESRRTGITECWGQAAEEEDSPVSRMVTYSLVSGIRPSHRGS